MGGKAQCYQWLHMHARRVPPEERSLHHPVVILSTFIGTASFAQDRFGKEEAVPCDGGRLAVDVAGIVSTIAQFLKVSELNEAHRIAALSTGKFFRAVQTEVRGTARSAGASQIIMHCGGVRPAGRNLPPIPQKVLNEFQKFSSIEGLIKPEVCDALTPTEVYEITEDERGDYQGAARRNKKQEHKAKRQATSNRRRR